MNVEFSGAGVVRASGVRVDGMRTGLLQLRFFLLAAAQPAWTQAETTGPLASGHMPMVGGFSTGSSNSFAFSRVDVGMELGSSNGRA